MLRVHRVAHRAMADAPLDHNPMTLPKHLRPSVRVKKEIVRPTDKEIRDFLAHSDRCDKSEYMYPLFRVSEVTGMPCGEHVGVARADADLDNHTIEVVRSVGVDGGEVFVKAPKSETGKRLVGLDPETIGVLKSHRERLAKDRVQAGGEWVDLPLGLDLVFRAGADGKLVRPDLVSGSFTRSGRTPDYRRG